MTGIRVVQAFGMERWESGRFARPTGAGCRIQRRSFLVRAFSSPLMEVMAAAGLAFVIGWVGGQILSGELAAGEVLLLHRRGDAALPAGQAAGAGRPDGAAGGRRRRAGLRDPRHPHRRCPTPGPASWRPFHEAIRYEEVSFAYGDAPVLHRLSLEIRKGEVVALVGGSGGGKTTVANLLPRFWDPTGGPDHHRRRGHPRGDPARACARSWRWSPRTPSSSTTPSATTSPTAAPDVPLAEVERAARMAQAHDFICRHAAGLRHPGRREGRRCSPAASGSGSPSPAPSSRTPPSSSSTRPPARSTPRASARCSARSSSSWGSAGGPPDHPGDRPPALHHPRRRPDRGPVAGAGRRGGAPRRAAGARRRVRPAAPPSTRARGRPRRRRPRRAMTAAGGARRRRRGAGRAGPRGLLGLARLGARRWSAPPGAAAAAAAGELRGAWHVHTTRSDGRGTLDEVLRAARAAGLQFVVVTDHNVLDPVGGRLARRRAGHRGHGGLDPLRPRGGRRAPRALTPEERDGEPLEAIAALGGQAVLAHPFHAAAPLQRLGARAVARPRGGLQRHRLGRDHGRPRLGADPARAGGAPLRRRPDRGRPGPSTDRKRPCSTPACAAPAAGPRRAGRPPGAGARAPLLGRRPRLPELPGRLRGLQHARPGAGRPATPPPTGARCWRRCSTGGPPASSTAWPRPASVRLAAADGTLRLTADGPARGAEAAALARRRGVAPAAGRGRARVRFGCAGGCGPGTYRAVATRGGRPWIFTNPVVIE